MPRGLFLLLCLALATAAPAEELRDIRGPVAITTLPPFLLTGGTLLLLGGLLLWRRKPRAKPPAHSLITATISAHEQLRQLAADYRRGVCSESELIPRLDRLLRDSIAVATGLPAPRLTTPELLAAATSVASLEMASLSLLLAQFDRFKFAGQRPTPAEVEQALGRVADFLGLLRVDQTP